ncbi:hypothetical protein BJY04DRAFT_145003 [Aspergillus karnatakaensis]|uniref:uncharacterized protein n=1 Tax=Aspergillus karnatakaensis TaxID=1810916 RepID=UPI003CCDC5DD
MEEASSGCLQPREEQPCALLFQRSQIRHTKLALVSAEMPVTPDTELCSCLKATQAATFKRLEAAVPADPAILPGQPRVSLANDQQVISYLRKEHLVLVLDRLAPRLWLLSDLDSGC